METLVLKGFRLVGLMVALALAGCSGKPDISDGVTLSYLVDPSAQLTVTDIDRQWDQFQPAPTTGINHPWTLSPYWFHLQIDQANWPNEEPGVALVINSLMLRRVEMYQDGERVAHAGYRVDISEQSIQHYNYVFLTHFTDEPTLNIYFKVHAGSRMNFQIQVITQQQFYTQSFLQYLGLGIFLGGALVMAGFNLVLALILFKSPYAYYSLYTLTLTAAVVFDTGMLRHLGVPFTNGTWGVFYNLPVMTGLLFFRSFLSIKKIAPRFDTLMRTQIAGALFLIIFGSLLPSRESIGLSYTLINQVSIILGVVSCVTAIGIALKHGFRPARWLAIAVASTALFLPITALVVFGVLPDFPLRLSLLRAALLLELLLFSLGLADLYREQSRARRRDQQRHQEKMGQLMREVHDNIATDIHAAILALPREIKTASTGLLQRALNNARDLASMLSQSHQGKQFSLEAGMRQYLNILQQHADKSASFSWSTQVILTTPMQLQLYRIFQEWMSNCLRHGGAKHFRVEVIYRPGVALMRIQSDGAPFRWDSCNNDSAIGAGLLNIQHRCTNLRARIRVMPGAQNGCRFVLRMPLQETST